MWYACNVISSIIIASVIVDLAMGLHDAIKIIVINHKNKKKYNRITNKTIEYIKSFI